MTIPAWGAYVANSGTVFEASPHGSHIVFFMEWQGETAIVRVLHKSRDYEELFDTYNPAPSIEGGKLSK